MAEPLSDTEMTSAIINHEEHYKSLNLSSKYLHEAPNINQLKALTSEAPSNRVMNLNGNQFLVKLSYYLDDLLDMDDQVDSRLEELIKDSLPTLDKPLLEIVKAAALAKVQTIIFSDNGRQIPGMNPDQKETSTINMLALTEVVKAYSTNAIALNISHIPEEDRVPLGVEDIAVREYGIFQVIPEDGHEYHNSMMTDEYNQLVRLLQKNGITLIEFDCDAPILKGAAIYQDDEDDIGPR